MNQLHKGFGKADTIETLQRLIYVSKWRQDFATEAEKECAYQEILLQARILNSKAGLTGILVAEGNTLIQVLEGPEKPLEKTFEAICRDLRHTNLKLIDLNRISQRAFTEWMGSFDSRSSRQHQNVHPFLSLFDTNDLDSEVTDILAKIVSLATIHADGSTLDD